MGLRYLGLQTDLLQLASFLEALGAVLHHEQTDAVRRRLRLAVGHGHHQHQVGHPAVCDEHLERRDGKGVQVMPRCNETAAVRLHDSVPCCR